MLPKTKEIIDEFLPKILPKILSTALSVKFWFCLALLITGLARGGTEGYGAAALAVGIYTGAKAYQNVQFAKNGVNNAKK